LRRNPQKLAALSIGGARDLNIGALKAKHIIDLGRGFGLNNKIILDATNELQKNLAAAKEAISTVNINCPHELRKKLIDIMEKRWNGSFDSIGPLLSKRQSNGVKHKI
jgi:hypothetical protein